MDKQLEASARAAIVFLNEHSYRYAIIGGIAMSQWGVVRATYDVDIKVLVPNYNYSAVRTALQVAFPQRARQQAPQNPLIVAVTIGDVITDFLLALPGYEELIIERAVLRSLDGWSAWICSAEDLIVQKVVAGRDKDWLDVEALLIEQRDRLDQAYIGNWLSQFVEALDKPEMLTRYQRLLTKVKAIRASAP